MAVSKKKTRSVLGDNPLSQGIFSKTVDDKTELPTLPPSNGTFQAGVQNAQELISTEQKSIFWENVDKEEKEAVNLRLPIQLNDWLNERLKRGKRLHKQKIPKEIWVQTALEFLIAMPVNWDEIEDEESLREVLLNIYNRIINSNNL